MVTISAILACPLIRELLIKHTKQTWNRENVSAMTSRSSVAGRKDGSSFNNPSRLQLFNENETAGQSGSRTDVENAPTEQNNRASKPQEEKPFASCCSSFVNLF